MRFFILQQPGRIEYNDHALSMKYSVLNVQLLPKAADLRKEAFDELRLNMLIVFFIASFTECCEVLALPNG